MGGSGVKKLFLCISIQCTRERERDRENEITTRATMKKSVREGPSRVVKLPPRIKFRVQPTREEIVLG